MKKALSALIILICIHAALFCRAAAVIQSSPKYDKIELSVEKKKLPPTVDGTVSDGEYGRLDITDGMLSYVVGSESDWSRIKNTSFDAYAAVCDGRFYFALVYELSPEYRRTDCALKNMWAQSCLLMSFAKEGNTGRTALELGIREDGRYIWRLAENGKDPATEQKVKYENGVYTYEFSVGLSSFCAEEDGGFLFCFSLSAGDYYDDGGYAYIQLGKGISGFSTADNADAGKDAALFPHITVKEEVAPTETESEPEPDTESEIPHSGDDGYAYVSVTLAAVCVLTVLLSVKYGKKIII